jgi:hypothetical protein
VSEGHVQAHDRRVGVLRRSRELVVGGKQVLLQTVRPRGVPRALRP